MDRPMECADLSALLSWPTRRPARARAATDSGREGRALTGDGDSRFARAVTSHRTPPKPFDVTLAEDRQAKAESRFACLRTPEAPV